MAEYYRHSGIVPTAGLIQTIFAGIGTAISLGIVYAYASVYLPFLYVHFLLTGEMPLAKLEDLTFLRLRLATCDTCDQSNYFDLVQVTLKIDKKGNVQTKTKSLVEKLAVAAADVPLVRNAGQAPAVAPSAEPELAP